MSGKQHVNAKIKGYNAPVFPEGIEQINQFLNENSLNGELLNKACQSIPGFINELSRPTSSDGYDWFWAIKFRFPVKKRILVAIPWAQDWQKNDDLRLDRSVAVYTNGVGIKIISELLDQLLKALQNV